MRKYLRHPIDIPIEFIVSETKIKKSALSGNMSICGLCFKSIECVEKDKLLTIKIPLINSNFELQGRVVRCLIKNDHVEIGIEFINQSDIFAARMVEQICYIKQYQKDIAEQQGRNLTDEHAAMEWISNHSAQFPK